jgi:REP element-mobilizing transposase RayT
MPRPLRIQYEGARYHVLSRGDRREDIFHSDTDRLAFLDTLGQACRKTGWQVHAYCLMSNHFHLILETPQPNLVVGMKWFLGTYTQRFNRKHGHGGHLFGGRYKAQPVDGRSRGYLRCVCDYVHLNPVRARMVTQRELSSYPWSSYPGYLRPKMRPVWLRVDRLLGEHGLTKDTPSARRRFANHMRTVSLDQDEKTILRRGWKIGAADFSDWLGYKLGRFGRKGTRSRERIETDEALAERMVLGALAKVRWKEMDLARRPKGHEIKVGIARWLRAETPMSHQWIAKRLGIGSASYLAHLLAD